MSEVRLIDAVGVMDDIEKYCGDYSCHDDNSFDKNAVRIAIKGAPTITPESLGYRKEVVGRWVPVTAYATKAKYTCSECARTIIASRSYPHLKFPYCHCGARMDGEP